MATENAPATRLRTPEECFEAGRRNAREKGFRLSPERARLVAAMVRPYLGRDDTAA